MEYTTKKLENGYSQNGWKGSNYDLYRDIKDIAKHIRKELKTLYSDHKFSITIARFGGGQSMDITLVEAKQSPYTDCSFKNSQVNEYYLNRDNELTNEACEMFKNIIKIVSSFNHDDSDSQTDYFSTRFYTSYRIGSWKKDFSQMK